VNPHAPPELIVVLDIVQVVEEEATFHEITLLPAIFERDGSTISDWIERNRRCRSLGRGRDRGLPQEPSNSSAVDAGPPEALDAAVGVGGPMNTTEATSRRDP
jgi:hypothetical protein